MVDVVQQGQKLKQETGDDDRVTVERVGGLAGFNLPGSPLKSRGELSLSALSAVDRRALNALFRAGVRDLAASATAPHAFRYRITRMVGNEPTTVEVAEDQVPLAIRNCVKNTLD